MHSLCTRCGKKITHPAIEVAIEIRGTVYTTNVVGQTCSDCRKSKIDPNELAAYSIGVAQRLVVSKRLTGRTHAFCRKALRISPGHYAKSLGISEQCLASLENSEAVVAKHVYEAMARRVRRSFMALVFTQRFTINQKDRHSAAS